MGDNKNQVKISLVSNGTCFDFLWCEEVVKTKMGKGLVQCTEKLITEKEFVGKSKTLLVIMLTSGRDFFEIYFLPVTSYTCSFSFLPFTRTGSHGLTTK